MNRALFLDRDGVINEDYGYVHKTEDFHFREGIFDVCRAAQKARMKIIVVTNQAGIGRGIYDHDAFSRLSSHMFATMGEKGVYIDGLFYCPYHELEGVGQYRRSSSDRKPNAGMIVKACNVFDINPFLSIMIGDKDSDRAAAHRAGIRVYIDASRQDWFKQSLKVIS
jgi:D-glycero-D-manno-heptose 1,7-bisphosphate phosphatase